MTEQQSVALVRQRMAHRPKIIRMFENCYRDTLENAVHYQEDGQVFLLTGDIPAKWLRDSTNQLRPYLLTAADSHDECSEYTFQRFDCPETDTLPCGGRGNPTAYTGMTWSGFRPSDDRCVYGYLVLSNMFAVVALGYMQQILSAFYRDPQYSPGPAAC